MMGIYQMSVKKEALIHGASFLKNSWCLAGGYFKNGLFVSFTVISEKYKRATKTPDLSTRKRGFIERDRRDSNPPTSKYRLS